MYETQGDLMQTNHPKHWKKLKSLISLYVIWAPKLGNNLKSPKSNVAESRFTHFFELACHIFGGIQWIPMSRGFRICMVKGGGESLRTSFGKFAWPNCSSRMTSFKVFFVTPLIFVHMTHFEPIVSLWAAIIWKLTPRNPNHTLFTDSWVRKDSVGTS